MQHTSKKTLLLAFFLYAALFGVRSSFEHYVFSPAVVSFVVTC